MKLMELAFTERDPLSEELQEWLCHDLSDLHQEAWDALLTADFVEGLLRCYSILRHRGERAFLDEFLAPEPVCPVVKYFQYRVFPCVTVTTFLESTFNSLNQVSGPHHLLVKKDASEGCTRSWAHRHNPLPRECPRAHQYRCGRGISHVSGRPWAHARPLVTGKRRLCSSGAAGCEERTIGRCCAWCEVEAVC